MIATTLTNTGDGHPLTTSSSTVGEGGLINQTNPSNDSNNYTKYSPKPFIVSKERFRSASSATTPPLLSNNNSSSTLSNNNNNQTLPSSSTITTSTIETLHSPPTIRDLNLPTVRKSRRKKPLTKDGETPQMSEEEYRRLMMLKRKSRFIYSSSLSTVNSRQKENSYNDAEGTEGIGSDDGDEVMMSESLEGGGVDDFSTLFDQLEGQDLETQFNNFLQALQGRTSSTPKTFNSSEDNNSSYHHDINNNNNLISQASNNNSVETSQTTMKNEGASPSSLHKQRHSEIPRVLMEHFQKEEYEWKQQVRQLHASNAGKVPDKYCQLSSFTLNNNNNGSTNVAATGLDLFESIGKVKNNNNIDSSIIADEQRRGHNQYNNNTFASASYSGTEGGHLHLINNNYSNPFYTSCSMMNENEYMQATSSTTDYSYPMFHTDDESSLMFDDDNPSPFEKLILDDDELLDYGDCDTYGEVDDEFNNNMTTMDDGMTVEEPPFFESTPPLQRPVYLSLQTLPVSPLMSATITSSELQRKSSTSSGVNSPSSTKTTTNNINNALTSSDELDVFNANNSLANLNEKDGSLSASPVAIDANRKTKVRRSSSSIPEDFNKFLQISSPQQQQLFQGASSPVRALSPNSSIACSPGKGSPHHSRKLSNNGIGHVRRNSGIKKQPRTNSYTVSSILGDPQLKPLFFDFLNEHHNSELVVFLQEEEEFRSECQNCIAPNIGKLLVEYEIKIERIKQIFETYIKPGANSELNLSNETRLKVENRVSALLIPPVITRHKGIGDLHLSRWISPDTFEAATTEVKISLKNHILPLFLENSRFENYLVQKHIQDNTVSNLRGKKIQRMLGYYIPESAKDTFYVNGATVGLDKQQQDQNPQHSQQQQHHYSTINDPTAKKSRPKKSLAALFGNTHQTPTQNHNTPSEPQVFPDTSPKSPFKNEQHKHQSLNKFKNWILGKRSNPSTEGLNSSSSWSTLSKKSQLTVNNASNSAPQFVGSSSHIKISPREMESSDPNKVSNSFLPLTMTGGQSNTPEINSLIRDGILFIKVHTKKRGNCKILEINVDKMSMLSEQDKKLANQLKNVLLTHTDADINPFDKYPHLRDFLQTKISVQSQKNWEEINEDCIIKVKSPPTSHFFKL